jgi:DNA polymerase-3 subunit delta
MKLTGRDAQAFFAKPSREAAGVLLYGADAMRVALRREQVIAALIGPEGEAEMRLERIEGADLRRDPAALADAMKAQGFFAGPRVVHVEGAGDAAAPAIAAALEAWQPGDAQLVVTAGQLAPRSPLRKLFEGARHAFAIGIYDDPPSRAEIEAALAAAGVGEVTAEAMEALLHLSRALDPGDFRQTVEKLALYKLDPPGPVTVEDVEAVAPLTVEAHLDALITAVAEGRAADVGLMMQRLAGQGVAPATVLIGATRHFRSLLAVASHPGGAAEGVGRLRPPVYGPRRDRLSRQAQGWGAERAARALQLLIDTDLELRSAGQHAPQMALVERALIRLAMMNRRR